MKIPVVEDNDSNYILVRHILKDYDPTRAVNGAEAVEKVRNGNFDFVLMDLKMPVMGEPEVTKKIREFDPGSRPGHSYRCAYVRCFPFRPGKRHRSGRQCFSFQARQMPAINRALFKLQ